MITIVNAGAEIVSTSYWATEHAAAGLCFLTGNAGTWRLLVPTAAEEMLAEMQSGRCATIEPSLLEPGCWDVVFEDGTDAPFALAIDRRQVDREMEPGECRLAVWTARGKALELDCLVRG